MKKTILKITSVLFLVLSLSNFTGAQEFQVQIEVLERDDCPHCIEEKEFLEELIKERDDIKVNYYDVTDEANQQLFTEVTELDDLSLATPITLIGDNIIQGFDQADTSGKLFKDLIDQAIENQVSLSFEKYIEMGGSEKILTSGKTCSQDAESCEIITPESQPFYVKVPFIGSVDVKQYSLPTMSLILGFIDGFNPCAMWVLVTFLLILVQVGDRKKMFQIAGLFIFAETIMYYLILNVWLSVWNFVKLENIITPLVGLLAIGGGLFFLWEWKTSDGTCKVTNSKQRSKTRSKIKAIANSKMTPLTILGVIGLALSVNVIEFACSIGIPQAFTKILDLNPMSAFYEQFLVLLYILMYMVDDFIVFGIAFYSIDKIHLTTKYSKICNLIGGILMLILGSLLIFAPELLVIL